LQGSLRTLLTAGLRGNEAIARLNEHLFANIPANRLITLFYGELDLAAGVIRYVNAGHNPPVLLRKNGSMEQLSATAVALGIVANAEVEAITTPLEPGDRLLLYTDGITEASNSADEEYGEERLHALLSERRELNGGELIDALLADVLAFCGRVRPRDDMTLLLLGRE
jgi:sigma-B regulation protein RsbU (phosphoserine phosphatase)